MIALRTCSGRALAAVFAVVATAASAVAQVDSLQTVAEASDYRATATSAEVWELCERLAAASPRVSLTTLGQSIEGKPIAALIVSDPPVKTAEEAKHTGKLIALLLGNIHAGEVDGKEALLQLVREFVATPGHPLLKELILVVVPNYNPDGNDRMAKTNRPGQVGPEEGMGGENGQGLDLNRDFVKLEAPETRALVKLLRDWNPHLFIDCHTTNGSYHRYLITHAGPKNPAGDRRINDYVHQTLLPEVGASMEKAHGWKSFPYGNFNRERTRWLTYGAEPRFSTSYVGLRNRLAILSEAYSYAPYRDRVRATRDFVRSILEFAAEHKAEIVTLLDDAAKGGQPGEPVAVRSEPRAREGQVDVVGYVEKEQDGRRIRTDEPKTYRVELWDDFAAKETVTRPSAYLLPSSFAAVAETLRRHGLDVKIVREDIVLPVELVRVEAVQRAERVYQNHRMVEVVTGPLRREARTVPAGAFLVEATGPLGSLAVSLLEARSEDGLTAWNAFDDALRPGEDFPVLRLPERPYPILTATPPPLPEDQRPTPATAANPSAVVRAGGGRGGFASSSSFGFQRWLDDTHFVQSKEGKTYKVEAATGRAEPFEAPPADDRSAAAKALAKLPTIGDDAARGLAQRLTLDAQRSGGYVEHDGDLYYATLDGNRALRLTSHPGREELIELSPDGASVAFVRDFDLYVVDTATATERAITSGGSDRIRHGKADWVYFEEIFNRSWKAYWWSPDSKHLAFLRTDDRMVPTHHVLIDTGAKRIVEETAYPRSGEPNPQVQLGLAPVGGGPVRYAELPAYSPDNFLISDVGWWPDGKTVYFYGQDRAQTWLDVIAWPIGGGAPKVLFRETTSAFVESLGPIRVLRDGTFLVQSERDGWKHLYRYHADGTLKNRVTSGEWEVRGVVRIDEDAGWIYLNGTKDNPLGNNLYRAKLDGSALERLTQGPGSHTASLSPGGTYFIDSFSGREVPPQAVLAKSDGTRVRTLDIPQTPEPDPNAPRREIARIPARDGFVLEAEVLLPAKLDTSGQTLYPVWLMTYGGPHAPTIRESWSGGAPGGFGLEGTLLSHGFIVFKLDPRSASGKGAASTWTAYRKLGVQELEDIKDGLAWLKQRPYVDGSRIGMSGHSYGGYLTAYCMTHSNLFAAGIAGAPVTDWRDYDSIYTERYMGTPQDNPEGYKVSSVVEAADKLHGKLLILHGAIDDNVSMRNTMRLVHALQQADKDFELMIYPGARHGIFGQHYTRLQREFALRTLGGPRPRSESMPAPPGPTPTPGSSP